MLETYVANYINILKDTYKNIDDLKGERFDAKINTQYLDVKEVKSKLVDEIARYFGIKKAEVNRLLFIEEY